MDWIKQWIKEVLADVPDSGYRTRTEKELHDHLETEYRALTEEGRRSDEARSEALDAMGEPEKLKKEYYAAWRNTLESRALGAVGWCGATILCGWISYAAFCLMWLPIRGLLMLNGVYPGDDIVYLYRIFGGTLSFWLPHIIEVLILRGFLSRYRYRTAAITASLLVNWAVGICFIIWWDGMDGRPPLSVGPVKLFIWWLNQLPSYDMPWITPSYLVMSVLGCILLGWFFGRKPVEGPKKMLA